MALAHLGVGQEISNIDSDTSEEAKAVNTFYVTAREAIQSDFPWPFLTRSVALGLVEEDPTTEWKYSYRRPSDAIKLNRIFSSLRNDTRNSRIPYRIYSDDTGQLIYTDCEEAVLEYQKPLTTEDKWPSLFVLAFSYLLASLIAPRLTKADPFKMRDKSVEFYNRYQQLAEQQTQNDEQSEKVPESEFVRAREEDVFPVPANAQSFIDYIS